MSHDPLFEVEKPKSPTFAVSEICEIIKTCGISGVTELDYQGLKLKLAGSYLPEAMMPIAPTIEQEKTSGPNKPLEAQTRESNEIDNYNKEREEVESMLITDPDAYFEAVKRGVLVDEERA